MYDYIDQAAQDPLEELRTALIGAKHGQHRLILAYWEPFWLFHVDLLKLVHYYNGDVVR